MAKLKKRLLLSIPIVLAVLTVTSLESNWSATTMAEVGTEQQSDADTEPVSMGKQPKKIINVPYISQEGTLPSGCELISAAMVLNHYGCSTTIEQVAARTPCADLIVSQNGLVGEHPSKAFIGNPYSEDGLGCYAPVIVSVMNSFLSQSGTRRAVDLTGTKLETLISDYIDRDTPVLIWATMNMQQPHSAGVWKIKDTDETFHWIGGEHCLVLVGYEGDKYFFNDPYESNGLITFEKKLVNSRFTALGQQAVVVKT